MGTLYIVGTPIGNMNDFTPRAIETLNSVDYIGCEDTRVSINLLRHFNINKKLVAYHKFNEKEKSYSLIEDLKNGKNIAIISDAGCPCISDPGSVISHEAIKEGIEVIAIPGPSAVITSLMSSGLDTSRFTFYGFLDRDNKHIEETLDDIKNDTSTLSIIYESPKRIIKTLEKIKDYLNDPYVCLSNDLTKKFEKKYYGKTSEVIQELNNNPNSELGEYVLIVEKAKEINKEESMSIEALLVDTIVKEKVTLKDAIKLVSEKYKLPKNEVYNTSLNLKNIFRG